MEQQPSPAAPTAVKQPPRWTLKRILASLALVLIALVFVWFVLYSVASATDPVLAGRLWPLSHISLELYKGSEDAKSGLEDVSCYCTFYAESGEETNRVGAQSYKYNVNGGEAGRYDFDFLLTAGTLSGVEKQLPVKLCICNEEAWAMLRLSCRFEPQDDGTIGVFVTLTRNDGASVAYQTRFSPSAESVTLDLSDLSLNDTLPAED